ncbi:hypothetical protein [Pseudoalteromonas denitrificans]|uniref:Uncharacterized protein n=1 Tax=Pseudoalteromonas denitrificans DSM 6059 TaxID=1123010 RepID=A0A1I1NKE3_9GAMM|nr:hypothetical protein [Pseudoalteromonas denitrificans]SFC95958.1 hypothetical protein SAMN02745724_03043 [Pseudoalteromonas denitrificans DSM 6059]
MELQPLGFINATGQSGKAFYAAVENNMLFSRIETMPIYGDSTLSSEYLTVRLPELENMPTQQAMSLMLHKFLQQTDIKRLNIKKLILCYPESIFNNDDIALLQSIVNENLQQESEYKQSIQQVHLKHNISVEFMGDLSFKNMALLEVPTLVIAFDSLVSYQRASKLNKTMSVQLKDGPLGVIPGEGIAAVIINNEANKNNHINHDKSQNPNNITITEFEGALSQQIIAANITSEDTVLDAGINSIEWQKEWYQNSQSIYKSKSNQALLLCPQISTVVGYLGRAQLLTTLNLALAYLQQPLKPMKSVFVILHNVEDNIEIRSEENIKSNTVHNTKQMKINSKLLKITRTLNNA